MADAQDPSGGITDADIDALLAEMETSTGQIEQSTKTPDPSNDDATQKSLDAVAAEMSSATVDQDDIEKLLEAASFESVDGNEPIAPSGGSRAAESAVPFSLPDLQRAMADAQVSNIDLLSDVDLDVKIELGRSKMLVEDVLRLVEGSVVELDKLAGDPVDVYVNERLVARGEVLVLNETFCVRVNEIVAGSKDDLL